MEHYELKRGGRLGPGVGDDKEATVLNLVVRWTEQGLDYEADLRHVEKLLESLYLEYARASATPGAKPLPDRVALDKPLPSEQHTTFRAADRPDIQFSAEEICRWMAAPHQGEHGCSSTSWSLLCGSSALGVSLRLLEG